MIEIEENGKRKILIESALRDIEFLEKMQKAYIDRFVEVTERIKSVIEFEIRNSKKGD